MLGKSIQCSPHAMQLCAQIFENYSTIYYLFTFLVFKPSINNNFIFIVCFFLALDGITMSEQSIVPAYVIINLLISEMPYRLNHVYQPAMFALTYLYFSVLYSLFSLEKPPYVYIVLDWANNQHTAWFWSINIFVGTCVTWIVLVGFCHFRNSISTHDSDNSNNYK